MKQQQEPSVRRTLAASQSGSFHFALPGASQPASACLSACLPSWLFVPRPYVP